MGEVLFPAKKLHCIIFKILFVSDSIKKLFIEYANIIWKNILFKIPFLSILPKNGQTSFEKEKNQSIINGGLQLPNRYPTHKIMVFGDLIPPLGDLFSQNP